MQRASPLLADESSESARARLSTLKRLVRSRLKQLDRPQWLTLLLGLVLGVLMLVVAGPRPNDAGSSILREAGIVTLGTVLVSLVYEFVLKSTHEEHLLLTVQDGLIANSRACGLSQIQGLDFVELFAELQAGDELWWLDTFCPDMGKTAMQEAMEDAIRRGVALRMLVIEPTSLTADARASEIQAAGYTREDFRAAARANLSVVESIKGRLSPDLAERLRLVKYSDLPCAPMYLRLRGGQPLEGWTSYFLSFPTFEVRHFHWSRPDASARRKNDCKGLGLEAFAQYFDDKWKRWSADQLDDARPGTAGALLEETRDVLAQLHSGHYDFVAALMEDSLRLDLIKPGRKVFVDGKLRRAQNSTTRTMLLDLAVGHTILLVHSTSENAIFHDPAHWRNFHEQLQERVQDGRLAGVERLFVVESEEQAQSDDLLAEQIRFHNETDGYECRVLSQGDYDRIQIDQAVTATPVHDFGIYNQVAYVWPRPGYANPGSLGYFQVDHDTVAGYKKIFKRCWEVGAEQPALPAAAVPNPGPSA